MEDKAVNEAVQMGASYAEIRIEERNGTALEVKDGELDKAVHGIERGASVRVLVNGRWGFSSTNRIEKGLSAAVERAVKLARSSANAKGDVINIDETYPAEGRVIMGSKKAPDDVGVEEKYAILREVDKVIRSSPGIVSNTVSFNDGTRMVHIVSSLGGDAYSEETRTVAQAVLVAKESGRVTGYRFRIGGVGGFEIVEDGDPVSLGEEAASTALRILRAAPCPPGRFPVVADPELAGVFIHEALGHAVEGDLVAAGGSVLSGKLGERLGFEGLNVYDDPTFPGGFGTFPFDQEATLARKKTIIEAGVLKEYLLDRESSAALGLAPNGSARAQDHSSRPLVRMSNTYIGNGDMPLEDILGGIKLGVYAKGTRGGQVDPTTGTFQFGAQEAFLIERGEITTPLRDMSISGNILETMSEIDALGNDFNMGDPGFCGKGGQMVPVGDGGPHVRIKMAVVGGR